MTLQSLLNPGIRAVLVKGEPGTGKTLFAFELLKLYGKGVYVSTRVSEEKALDQYPGARALFKQGKLALANPKAKGAKFEDVRLGNLAIVIESILDSTSKLREPLMVLDSWDAIAKEAGDTERARAEKTLLALADAKKFRLVFISEEPGLTTTDYMADAIVLLKDDLFDGMRVRRIEWRKLRGTEIPQKSQLFSLWDARFTVFQAESVLDIHAKHKAKPFQPVKNTTERYSTGSKDLDALTLGGLERGSTILLELGRRLGARWDLPLLASISCNFIANGGCTAFLPALGVPPEMVHEAHLSILPKEIVESSLRIAHFGETPATDACFFQLDPSSLSKSFDMFWQVVGQLTKVGEGRRPNLTILSIDRLEMMFGHEYITPIFSRGPAMTRYYGDATIFIAKHSTSGKDTLADATTMHLKLDEIDGALVIHSVRPPSRIHKVSYDYSQGYPSVKLTPVA